MTNRQFSNIAIAAVTYAIQAVIDLEPCNDVRVAEFRELERRLVTKLQERTQFLTHDLSCAFDYLVRTVLQTSRRSASGPYPVFQNSMSNADLFVVDDPHVDLADVVTAERAQALDTTKHDVAARQMRVERWALGYAATKLEETAEAGTRSSALLLRQLAEELK